MRRYVLRTLIPSRRSVCSAACLAALAAAAGAQGASAQLTDLHGVATPLSPAVSGQASAPVTQAAAQTSGPTSGVGQIAAAPVHDGTVSLHGAVPILATPSSGGPSTAPGVPTAATPRTPARAAGGPVLATGRPAAAPAAVVAAATTRVQTTLEGAPAAVRSGASVGSTVVAAVTHAAPPSVRGTILPTPGAPSAPVVPVLRTVLATPGAPGVPVVPVLRTVLPTPGAVAVSTVAMALREAPVEGGSSLLPTTAAAAGGGTGGLSTRVGPSGGGILAGVTSVAVPARPATAGRTSGTGGEALGGQRHGGSPAGGAGFHGGGPGATPARDLPAGTPSIAIVTATAPTDPPASGLASASAAVGHVATGPASSAYVPAERAGAPVAAGGHEVKAASSRPGFFDAGRLMVMASLVGSRAGGLVSRRGAVDPASASAPGGEMTPLAPAGSSPSVAGSSSAAGMSLLLTLAILAIAGNATAGRRLRLASLPKRAAPVLLLPARPG